MQPMPGKPMPEAGPDQGQPGGAPDSDAKKDSSSPAEVVAEVHDGLMHLMDMMNQAKLPPDDIKQLSAIVDAYQQFVEKVLGGSQGDDQSQGQAPAAPGAAPMESAGKPGAQPAY